MIPQLERTFPGFSFIELHNGPASQNAKVSFVAFDRNEPTLLLKTVREPRDNDVIRLAFDHLCSGSTWAKSVHLPLRMPEPRWIQGFGEILVSAETLVSGRPLRRTSPQERTAAFRLLKAWTSVGAGTSTERLDPFSLARRLGESLHLGDRTLYGDVDRQLDVALHEADGLRLPAIPAHGDYTPGNLLVDPARGEIGLVDWDRFADIQIPLFDLLTFVDRAAPESPESSAEFRAEVRTHLEILGLDDSALPLLAFLYTLATEWRKRARFHPFETGILDAEFKSKLESHAQRFGRR